MAEREARAKELEAGQVYIRRDGRRRRAVEVTRHKKKVLVKYEYEVQADYGVRWYRQPILPTESLDVRTKVWIEEE